MKNLHQNTSLKDDINIWYKSLFSPSCMTPLLCSQEHYDRFHSFCDQIIGYSRIKYHEETKSVSFLDSSDLIKKIYFLKSSNLDKVKEDIYEYLVLKSGYLILYVKNNFLKTIRQGLENYNLDESDLDLLQRATERWVAERKNSIPIIINNLNQIDEYEEWYDLLKEACMRGITKNIKILTSPATFSFPEIYKKEVNIQNNKNYVR